MVSNPIRSQYQQSQQVEAYVSISGLNLSRWLDSGFSVPDAARAWLRTHVTSFEPRSRKPETEVRSLTSRSSLSTKKTELVSDPSSLLFSSSFLRGKVGRVGRVGRVGYEEERIEREVCLHRIPKQLDEGLERAAQITGLSKREAAIEAFNDWILKISKNHPEIIIQLAVNKAPVTVSEKMKFLQVKAEVTACFAVIDNNPDQQDKGRDELIRAIKKLELLLHRVQNPQLHQQGSELIKKAESYFEAEEIST